MARRMFSNQIVDSDAFLDMPSSAQNLYFHLGMRADDDGFVGNPRKIQKMVGGNDDDLKVLLGKRFVLGFESGVIVIKHWLIHNQIRKDRYNETQYLEEKKSLKIKDNKAYTELRQPNGNQLATQVRLGKDRLGEVREGKDRLDNTEDKSSEISGLIKLFEGINPACKRMYGNKTQRKACSDLIENYTYEKVAKVIEKTLPAIRGLKFFPVITTPLQLQDKWSALENAIVRHQAEQKPKYI